MGCTGGDRRGVGEKRRPRVVTPSGPLGGGRGPGPGSSWAIAARRRLIDAAATSGLMYLDGYAVATTDLGRGRMKSHHYLSHHCLQEVCAITKPEHGASAVARGPPVLMGTSRVDPVRTRRKCRGNRAQPQVSWPPISGGAPASRFFKHASCMRPARVLHASCTRTLQAFPAGLPGEIPRVGPFSGLRTGRIHNPQSQTTR